MNDDAIDCAYNELGRNLKSRQKTIIARANTKLRIFSDRALPRVDQIDVDDAVLRLNNSGFLAKTDSDDETGEAPKKNYSIGEVYNQETVFSQYAQCAATSFKNAAEILTIDIRSKDALKALAENTTFNKIASDVSPALTMRCNALLRDIAIVGTICNLLDLSQNVQEPKNPRRAVNGAVREYRAGPTA